MTKDRSTILFEQLSDAIEKVVLPSDQHRVQVRLGAIIKASSCEHIFPTDFEILIEEIDLSPEVKIRKTKDIEFHKANLMMELIRIQRELRKLGSPTKRKLDLDILDITLGTDECNIDSESEAVATVIEAPMQSTPKKMRTDSSSTMETDAQTFAHKSTDEFVGAVNAFQSLLRRQGDMLSNLGEVVSVMSEQITKIREDIALMNNSLSNITGGPDLKILCKLIEEKFNLNFDVPPITFVGDKKFVTRNIEKDPMSLLTMESVNPSAESSDSCMENLGFNV